MMKNRTFFFVKNIDAAKTLVPEITQLGIDDADIHVIANEDIALEPLPEPDIAHRSDFVDAAKRGALTGGTLGTAGSIIAVTVPAVGLTLGGGAILAGAALGTALGAWFSTLVGVSVPNQDVEQYRDRIDRGEVMVIVDIDEGHEERFVALIEDRFPGTLLARGSLDAA